MTFIAEDWEANGQPGQPPLRRPNSYYADSVPNRAGSVPGSGDYQLIPQQENCDPAIMNGNGPPRLRPPGPPGQPGPYGTPGRSPSMETARPPGMPPGMPPGGIPPRSRGSRTPMSPEDYARRSREQEEAQNFQRDCFIIPQESVERFLPDGISVRVFSKLIKCSKLQSELVAKRF